MLDGSGGYIEDLAYWVGGIDLNLMLAGAERGGPVLSWSELFDA